MKPEIRSTTVLVVRREGHVVMAADGQVTLNDTVLKHGARKTRRLYNEKVLAGQKILEINATGRMEVQLAVPETTIDSIRVGETASITFPTLPGEPAQGRIS